jgi:hypothetical protein
MLTPHKQMDEPTLLHYVYQMPQAIKEAVEHAIASPELVESRMEQCKTCPDFRESTGQCKHCGCFMPLKTRLQVSKCPEGHW